MGKTDLHLHSTASDGRLSPAQIVRKAASLGLTTISLTDHDTVDGIIPALEVAQDFPQLRVIPGIEISTEVPQGEIHMLGYFIDYTDPELKATLERMRSSRIGRARGMIAKLDSLGIRLDWKRVQKIAGSGSVGRPHIAQAMLEKGYISSFKEAFDKYISRDGPAYVEREKITPAAAVTIILKARGLPVLAHPFTAEAPEQVISELVMVGLIGVEVYYNGYTEDERTKLLKMAGRYNLIATGGSDFHGIDSNMETVIGDAQVPPLAAKRLMKLAQQRGIDNNL